MAVVAAVISEQKKFGANAHKVLWETCLNTDTGEPVTFPGGTIKSFQVTGTFGGATVTIEGSNDGTNYAALTTNGTTAATATTAGIKNIFENTLYIRCNVTGGGGTTDLDVTLLVRRPA